MPTQGTFEPIRIVCGLWCTLTLLGCVPSHAEEPPPRSGHRVVYRCMLEDVLTLTDLPCNGDRIDIDLNRNVTLGRPAKPAARESTRPQRRTATDTAAKQLAEQRARCDRLRAQLDALQAKLRSGYTAAAGIRLEERKRHLREQARSAKCPAA